jgi:hypothetical protein
MLLVTRATGFLLDRRAQGVGLEDAAADAFGGGLVFAAPRGVEPVGAAGRSTIRPAQLGDASLDAAPLSTDPRAA